LRICAQPERRTCATCDLLLVFDAVELGFHRIRRGRDLTQRKRGTEHFDE
jgi:hypothetical protein